MDDSSPESSAEDGSPPVPPAADVPPDSAEPSIPQHLESDMAIPTAVNGQITDAVTQSNVSVLGNAPAEAMGALFLAAAHAQGLAAANTVAAQQQAFSLAQAVTTRCVMALLDGKAV